MKQEPLIIDRVEGNLAVTEDGLNIPLQKLPSGAGGGQHFKLVRDEESEQALSESIEELQDELRDPSGKGSKHI